MDALISLLGSLAWPEFPDTRGAQAAFIAAAISALIGLLLLVFPATAARLFCLASRETRSGAIGEVRACGGFMLGLALSTLVFDQSVSYTALGVALVFSCFGRILSLMSDHAAGVVNVTLLLLQAVIGGALLYYFFDVFTADMTFSMPEEIPALLAFYAYVGIGLAGASMMFAPRISGGIAGIEVVTQAGLSTIRSAGGFALGAGALATFLVANTEARATPFDKLLYVDLAFTFALIMAVLGRFVALALNRGNYIYASIAIILEGFAVAAIAGHIAAILQ